MIQITQAQFNFLVDGMRDFAQCPCGGWCMNTRRKTVLLVRMFVMQPWGLA